MNAKRRKAIEELSEKITEAKDTLGEIKDDEETYMNNMPENLQCSSRYEAAENAVEELEEAISNLESALENLEGAVE